MSIMKTYNKTYLPDSIIYNGAELKMNPLASSEMNQSKTHPATVAAGFKKDGRLCVFVNVLSNNLKGKIDLHGRPYKPTKWVFTN